MKRILKNLVIIFAVILLIVYSLLCSNIMFRHVTLSLINSFIPVKISVEKWTFRPWKSVNASGVTVADISSKTGGTNFYLSAKSLKLDYKVLSFLSEAPYFLLVEAEEIKVITAETRKKKVKKKESHSQVKRQVHKDQVAKPSVMPDFPVIIKKLIIRNSSFSYTDTENKSFGINDFNIAGINVGREDTGSAIANGTFFYNDGKRISMDYIPFAWEMDYTMKGSIIPSLFSSTLLVSNVIGNADKINLSPLSAELTINMSNENKSLNFSKCILESYWGRDKISILAVTGKIDLIKNIIDCQAKVDIWSNDFYHTLISSYEKYDISQGHATGIFNFNSDGTSDKYKINGEIVLRKVYTGRNKKLPPLNFEGAFDIAYNNRAKKLEFKEVGIFIKDNKRQLVELKTIAPVLLDFSGKKKDIISTNEISQVSLLIEKLNLKYFNEYTGEKNIAFHSGEISSKIICNVLKSGDEINIKSSFSGDDINFSYNKSKWESLGIKINMDGNINKFNAFFLSRFNSDFYINKKKTGEIAAGGFHNIKTGNEKIAVAAVDVSGMLFRPMIDSKAINKDLDNLLLNLQVLSVQKPEARKRDISINIDIENTKRLSGKELDKLTLDINAKLSPDKLKINNCKFFVSPGKWEDNNLNLTGKVNLKKMDNLTDLSIYSKHFDATVLFDTLMSINKSDTKKASKVRNKRFVGKKKEKKEEKKTAFKEPVPLKYDFINLKFKTHIDEFVARKMIISPLSFDFVMKSNNINFLTHNMTVNEGSFDLGAQVDLGVTGYVYTSVLKTKEVPLKPILEIWAPEVSDKILGNIDTKISLSGKGFSTTNLIKYLKSNVKIQLNDGHFEEVPLLTDLSKMLKIDDLDDYFFDKCIIKAKIINGTNFINDVNIESKTIKMGINGYTTINENINLDVYLALSGKIVNEILTSKRLKFKIPFTAPLDKFYQLPLPIKILGDYNKPDIESNVKEFVPMLLKSIGMNAASVLGQLFGNNKKGSEEVQKEAQKEGVELLKGLWDELKKLPVDSLQKKHNLPHKTK